MKLSVVGEVGTFHHKLRLWLQGDTEFRKLSCCFTYIFPDHVELRLWLGDTGFLCCRLLYVVLRYTYVRVFSPDAGVFYCCRLDEAGVSVLNTAVLSCNLNTKH